MSLINNMLKDLDKQKRRKSVLKQKDIADIFSRPSDKVNTKDYYSISLIVSSIVAMVVVIVLFSWFFGEFKTIHNSNKNLTYDLTPRQTVALTKWKGTMKKAALPPRETQQHYMHKEKLAPSQDQITQLIYNKALDDIEQGRVQEAAVKMESILKINPNNKVVRKQLVALLISQKRFSYAAEWLKRGMQEAPDYVPFIELKGRLLLRQGQVREALAILQTVSPSMHEAPNYYTVLADVHRRLGHDIEAAKIYERLLQINPDNSYWWLGLGISLEAAGEGKFALKAYQNALSDESFDTKLQQFVQSRIHELGG